MRSEAALWASLVLVFCLLVVPGAWDGAFSGTPLGWSARLLVVGLAAVSAWGLTFRPQRPAAPWAVAVLAGLIALKLLVGAVDGPTGWLGSYTLVDTDPPRTAPFFERLKQRPYRFDRAVEFTGHDFALHFLNDVGRYNVSSLGRDRTQALPINMAWSAWFDAHRPQTLTVYVDGNGEIEVLLDGRALDLAGGQHRSMAVADVQPREHQVVVMYRKPADTPARVSVEVLLDGERAALRAFAHRPPLGRRAALISDGAVMAGLALVLGQLWLAFGRARLRPRLDATVMSGVVAWVACAYVMAAAFGAAQADMSKLFDLGAGDDPLAYESNARNIMEEGLLMPLGRPIGQGTPYFFYPLYSYALAAVHWLVGEDYDAVRLFNGLCSAALPLLLWGMGWRTLGLPAQLFGMAVLSWLVVKHSGWYWQAALTDNLFIPLAIAGVWLAGLCFRSDTRRTTVASAGLVAALAGSTRPSFLLFVAAFAATMLVLGKPLPMRERWLRTTLFVGAYGLGLLPVVLRNYIMSGQAVMVVTLSHAITVALVPPEGGIVAPPMSTFPPTWLEAVGGAWQMFRAEPALLLWLELRKILFTLGFTNLGPSVIHLQYEFPVLLAACAASLWRPAMPRWFLLGFLAFFVSHMAAVVIAYPWTYGYKSILPVQYLFLFCGLYLTKSFRGAEWPRHGSWAAGRVSGASPAAPTERGPAPHTRSAPGAASSRMPLMSASETRG